MISICISLSRGISSLPRSSPHSFHLLLLLTRPIFRSKILANNTLPRQRQARSRRMPQPRRRPSQSVPKLIPIGDRISSLSKHSLHYVIANHNKQLPGNGALVRSHLSQSFARYRIVTGSAATDCRMTTLLLGPRNARSDAYPARPNDGRDGNTIRNLILTTRSIYSD